MILNYYNKFGCHEKKKEKNPTTKQTQKKKRKQQKEEKNAKQMHRKVSKPSTNNEIHSTIQIHTNQY